MEKQKILVVDDEPDIVETVRFSLEQEGYEVSTATDGLDGLEKARRIQPDLIVLDVMMPKENGYRVSGLIREDEEAGKISKKIPIILLTARDLSGEPDREKMFMEFSKADLMMYKPFEMDEFLGQVKKLLEN